MSLDEKWCPECNASEIATAEFRKVRDILLHFICGHVHWVGIALAQMFSTCCTSYTDYVHHSHSASMSWKGHQVSICRALHTALNSR